MISSSAVRFAKDIAELEFDPGALEMDVLPALPRRGVSHPTWMALGIPT